MNGLDVLSLEFWTTVVVSIVCGSIVGFERQLRGKPLDVRTAVLVCLGTAIYIRLGVVISGDHADTMRILGQVVTGIGFLGAGAILRSGHNVHGLTTAATIWVNSAIGMATGLGLYTVAAGGATLTLVVLAVLPLMERVFDERGSADDQP